MPNMGRPSSGCLPCRRMKVRCDEGRPACSRCVRGKRICTGYRNNFLFVDPGKRRSKAEGSEINKLTGVDQALLSQFGTIPTTVDDWYDRSLKLFFHTYTHRMTSPNGIKRRSFDLLEGYCSRPNLEPYLVHALKAASLSNMAYRVPSETWLGSRALSHRCEALSGIKNALANEVEARKDDLLIALWCIEKAELMDDDQGACQNHTSGFSTILRLRGEQQLSSELGCQLFYQLNTQLLIKDALFGTDLHCRVRCILPRQFRLMSKVATLAKDYRDVLTSRLTDTRESLMERALLIDSELQKAKEELVEPHTISKSVIGAVEIDVYEFTSMIDAFPWLNYYTSRIRVLNIAMECSKAPQDLHITIKAEFQGLIALLPTLLGQTNPHQLESAYAEFSSMGAIGAMFCCSMILNTPGCFDEDVRTMALDSLQRIGRNHGFKQALSFRDYYMYGHAVAGGKRLIAMSERNFDPMTPSFISGHERPIDMSVSSHRTKRDAEIATSAR